jgi:hypothetical protein
MPRKIDFPLSGRELAMIEALRGIDAIDAPTAKRIYAEAVPLWRIPSSLALANFLNRCGFVRYPNIFAADGYWEVSGTRRGALYVRNTLDEDARMHAVNDFVLAHGGRPVFRGL